ncbi:MAG: UDP-3-O-(3-hydroxymyristoyl)glucosamine N-acyltransferase [Stappiaceae bacterium]
MTDPQFYTKPSVVTVSMVAEWAGAELTRGNGTAEIVDVAPLDDAVSGNLVFLDNNKYFSQLENTQATACLIAPRFAKRVPDHVMPLVVAEPYRAYAKVLTKLYPEGIRPLPVIKADAVSPKATIAETVVLEAGVTVEAGVVVGDYAEIGADTHLGPNAVIGANCKIGRNCSIGPNTTCQHVVIGDNVIIHPGVCIGQDGFGFAMGVAGHLKVPQIGRVIIQDGVEIGANTTIDRGANRDTIIGEGTKIDNQVQVAHNVVIGRHCVLVSQVGIAGSAALGDYVAIGGQSGVNGHVKVGSGTQVAAVSSVYEDLPGGGKYGGVPAKPLKDWFREVTALSRLASTSRTSKKK